MEDEPKQRQTEIELPPNGTSLELLQLVYRCDQLPLTTRMRAAMACLPMEHPRLSVVAQMTEHDFAVLLDKRLENLKRLEQAPTNGKVIEAAPAKASSEPALIRRPMPAVTDRRYRRY
jgi:hypothetical protein